jgi:hypothetical protein
MIPLSIENQPIAIVASGIISVAARGHNDYLLKLDLTADLSDLQQNMTGILRSQLDKDEHYGDRIANPKRLSRSRRTFQPGGCSTAL